jgi:hypothetical protein
MSRTKSTVLVAAGVFAAALAAAPLAAQAPAGVRLDASTRATAEATLRPPRVQGQPAPAPLKVRIDYGQPHARGRQVVGGLIPKGEVWRFGANAATTLVTDVDLTIGGTAVPKGTYTLFALYSDAGWQLIVNRKTGQWGTEYDASQDLARIPVQARTLAEPVESFSISLVPAGDGAPRGTLRFAWGTAEGTVAWTANP